MRCEGFRRILVFGVVVCFFGAGVTPNMLTRTVKADLTTGLVGYWSFDNELDPLNDDSNNGHDASNHGGTWVDNGVSGGAFQFDDDTDYIDVPDHSDFDFGTGSFTLCCWVKTTKQDYMYILDKDPSGEGNPAFFVRMNKLYPNELTFVTGSTGNPDDRLTTTESFTNGDWHFLVFKRDSSESKKYIYFDGQLSASAAAPMYDVSNSEPLLIVSWNFQGIVDEVRVYNRALSASEIQQLYNQGGGGNQPPTEGLVGYWSFDEGSGSIAHDYSGNGNDGTIYGASWDTDGSSGNCLYFDGDGDYVDVGYVTSSNIKTFNIWVKPDSTITKNTGSPGPGNTLHLATFSLGQNFALGNSTVLVQDETITLCWNKKPNRRTCVINLPITPSWHMITCVWNLEEERYDVYFDGIKQSVSSGTVTHVPLFSANDFEINRDNSRYNGKIDEVRIYDRVLSESEIQQLYNQGGGGNQPPTEGLVGYWSFDEGSGSIAHDYSGNGNDGTIYGASWTTDTPSGNGYALSFDGINDYVDCGNDVSLNPENEITLAAWYKPVSFAGCGNSPIIDKGYYTNTDPYYQYHLGVTGDNYHQPPSYAYAAFLFHVSADDTLYGVPTPDGFWTAGTWYHIAGTYDGSTVKLYVNGDLIDSVPASGTMQDYGKNVYFGRFTNKNAYTPGTIDEVRIYNRALSASEIQQLYNQGGGGNQPPVADAGGPYSGNVGEGITFDGSGSYDPDGSIVGYRWDWTNDGAWDTGWLSSPIITHSYSNSGTYTIKLQVKDNDGATDVATAGINITVPSIDSDGDGWNDYDEINKFYTNPNKPDTDGDGIIDPQDVDPLVDIKLNIDIEEIAQIDDLDIIGTGDFTVFAYIDGQKVGCLEAPDDKTVYCPTEPLVSNYDVQDDKENVDIEIELIDRDTPIIDNNDRCDISGRTTNGDVGNNPSDPESGRNCKISYNLKTSMWEGDDYIGDDSGYGHCSGSEDGSVGSEESSFHEDDCEIRFRIYQNDKDNDNLCWWLEVNVYGTNPTQKDTDGDGWNDGCDFDPTDDTVTGQFLISTFNYQKGPIKGGEGKLGAIAEWYGEGIDLDAKTFDIGVSALGWEWCFEDVCLPATATASITAIIGSDFVYNLMTPHKINIKIIFDEIIGKGLAVNEWAEFKVYLQLYKNGDLIEERLVHEDILGENVWNWQNKEFNADFNTFLEPGGSYQIRLKIYIYAVAVGCVDGGAPDTAYVYFYDNYGNIVADKLVVSLGTPDAMTITAYSPIDLIVTDPLGRSINKSHSDIPDATYLEDDFNFDNDLDDRVYIPHPLDGKYFVSVTPKLGADPEKTYTIKVVSKGGTYFLAENASLSDIPEEPYIFAQGYPPETYLTAPKGEWVTSATEFYLTSIDDLSGVNKTYYRIWYKGNWTPAPGTREGKGNNFTIYTGNFTLVGEGKHYLEYYSVDNAGNVEDVHNQTHYVDDTPPVTTLEFGTPYYTDDTEKWITTSTLIYLNATDYPECGCGVEATYYCFDGESWQEYTEPFTIDEECQHTIEYYSIDYLGNEEEHHTTIINVDDTPPTTTIEWGQPYYTDGTNEWITSWTTVYLNATDHPDCTPSGVKEIHYNYGDGWNTAIGSHATFTIPDECNHTIQWYATDNLGNTEPTNTRDVKVDNTPPTTNKKYGEPYHRDEKKEWITSHTPIQLNPTDNPTCSLSGVNNTYYKIDNNEWKTYTQPFTIPEECMHKIYYYSNDNLGNTEKIKNQTVYIDNTPPSSNITINEPKFNWTKHLLTQIIQNIPPEIRDIYLTLPLFVTNHTHIRPQAQDQGQCPVGIGEIYYRTWNTFDGWTKWQKYEEKQKPIDIAKPGFTLKKQGPHYIEYYSQDLLRNKEKPVHNQTCLVDDTPPETTASGYNPIILKTTEHGGKHTPDEEFPPVGLFYIHYRYKIGENSEWTNWFTTELQYFTGYITITHHSILDPVYVDYYATDILGNKEETHHDVFTNNPIGPGPPIK